MCNFVASVDCKRKWIDKYLIKHNATDRLKCGLINNCRSSFVDYLSFNSSQQQ